jgi:thiosulfate/3-mercaptopyruvate sulfurtransferase
MARLGISLNSIVVVYGNNNNHANGTRFTWTLATLGIEKLFYLDGGREGWVAQSRPTAVPTEIPDAPAAGFTFTAIDKRKDYLAEITEVIHALENPKDWVVLSTTGYPGNLRFPTNSGGGANSTIADIAFLNGFYRPAEDIKAAFNSVIQGRNVIYSCGSGQTATPPWLIVSSIVVPPGKKVLMYDGSSTEWVAISNLTTFDNPQVEEVSTKAKQLNLALFGAQPLPTNVPAGQPPLVITYTH